MEHLKRAQVYGQEEVGLFNCVRPSTETLQFSTNLRVGQQLHGRHVEYNPNHTIQTNKKVISMTLISTNNRGSGVYKVITPNHSFHNLLLPLPLTKDGSSACEIARLLCEPSWQSHYTASTIHAKL